jgi:hypothetical protein
MSKVRATLSQIQLLRLFSGKTITINLPPGATEIYLVASTDDFQMPSNTHSRFRNSDHTPTSALTSEIPKETVRDEYTANRMLKDLNTRFWKTVDRIFASPVKDPPPGPPQPPKTNEHPVA